VRSALLTAVGLMLMAGTGHADEALEIVIYGATGEVGSHAAREALSRADFAVALIDEAEQARYSRQRISVAY